MTPSRRHGLAWMIGAGLCWSLGGVLVRGIDSAGTMEIVFWRSAFMALVVGAIVLAMHGARAGRAIGALGWNGLGAALCLQGAFFSFIAALAHTTVANTLVIMSTAPLATAILARLTLGEAIALRTLLAIVAALGGIALMVADGLSRGGALGDLIACLVPLCMAGHFILLRRQGPRADLIPVVLLAGLISLAIALPLAWPLRASASDLGLLALMGVVQLGLGCVCLVRAARHLAAAEIGLLALLETILGPVWVWLVFDERPTHAALLGGLIVVAALATSEAIAIRRRAKDALASAASPGHVNGMRTTRP